MNDSQFVRTTRCGQRRISEILFVNLISLAQLAQLAEFQGYGRAPVARLATRHTAARLFKHGARRFSQPIWQTLREHSSGSESNSCRLFKACSRCLLPA